MSMELTKRLWEQPTDKGVLAYHIIQSFSPGEATPDQVHEIGCEFARRFLADRFECTVSTHLDKGHLHNHIVVNSVSYADGKMFRNNFDTYYHGIRQVSDELCRENRLSVIETDGKGKSYDEWLSGQAGKPTIRGMVRKDVEQAIAAADSFDGFITELQNMGYTVKYGPRVEHMAVRHKDAQRNIRIDRLDPRFSETALREYYRQLHRMPTEMQQEYRQENAPAKPKWQPTELQPTVRRARYLGKLPRRYPKVSGFMACGIIRIRFQINKIRAWQQRLQQFGRGETQASEYGELRDRQPPFAHDQHGKRDCPHDDADGDDHCGNGEDVHDRRQPTRQRGIEFRPDDILIALAVHGTHAKPPDAGGSGKHQQTEHHAQHDAGHARMAGQRIRLSQAFVDILRRKHRLDFAHIRERQRFQRFRRRCCRGLLKHIHRLLWISDKWLEFVGHSHREYGIAPTVGNESEKI